MGSGLAAPMRREAKCVHLHPTNQDGTRAFYELGVHLGASTDKISLEHREPPESEGFFRKQQGWNATSGKSGVFFFQNKGS